MGYRLGLKPDQLYSTSLYDLSMMAKAFEEDHKAQLDKVRIHAWLVCTYSGLDSKARRKLTPQKMLPLDRGDRKPPDAEEIAKWHEFFKRKVISKKVYN